MSLPAMAAADRLRVTFVAIGAEYGRVAGGGEASIDLAERGLLVLAEIFAFIPVRYRVGVSRAFAMLRPLRGA